ncbi:MAG: NAD(P)-dependent oxidoreductase [Phycisphaerales bacterium]|jgi:nucleoside-diphosphate-sugar epimerase|nr:NAD(P)-dependent oxidoreductase [Phycisphaerales bacterium]
MNIAMTGGSGFIGSVTTRLLADQGHRVRVLVRPQSRRDHIRNAVDAFVEGSTEDRESHQGLLEGADALIHNAVNWGLIHDGRIAAHLDTNLVASIELFNLAASANIPVVFVSSVAVHHTMLPAWNGLIDHAHPTRPGGLYGACKAALESHLWALAASHDLHFTVIRPAAVYGIDPNLPRSIGAPIIEQVRSGSPFTRPGGGKFVHVDDVAAAIAAPLQREVPSGGIYHLADCYARWSDWAAMVCEITGVRVDIDTSSPPQPMNTFETDALAEVLGVTLDRGHEGIRGHLEELASRLP